MITDQFIGKVSRSGSRYKVGAVAIDRRGNFLGVAVCRPRFDHLHGGEHAEMVALRKWGKRVKSIFLMRTNKTATSLLPIEPCERCQRVLNNLGIQVLNEL